VSSIRQSSADSRSHECVVAGSFPRSDLQSITRTTIVRVMAHITSSVEYGIHCLLWLVDIDDNQPSSRDLADLQGVSASFVAKIFPKLEKARIVTSNQGVRGGYRLAKPAEQITVLAIVDAIEGKKSLFDCQEIRRHCAEKAMRDALAQETLASIARTLSHKAPNNFGTTIHEWLNDRSEARRSIRTVARSDRPPNASR
jgi:Rrf2 family protein